MLSGDTAAAAYLIEVFSAMAAAQPQHQFFFITENTHTAIPETVNVKKVLLSQQSGNPLLWKLWYHYKVPVALRKIKADVLVSAAGIYSLRTKLPQCLLLHDLWLLHYPEWYSKRYVSFAKSNLTVGLQKAQSVITFSAFTKNELAGKYKTGEHRIQVLYPAPNKNHQPISWKERERVKEKYAGGKEFFLFHGPVHSRSNLINLLKAFSFFKKRQKSSMQLLISTGNLLANNTFVESLRLYKYRNEVQLLPGIDAVELRNLTAAAYAGINLSPCTSDHYFLQHAVQSGVPVIAGNIGAAPEMLGEAALYADAASHENIAEQMMLLYKDENRRNELIKKGLAQAGLHSFAETCNSLWQNIQAIAKQ